MACFRVCLAVFTIVSLAHGGQVPLPYASANFDNSLESSKSDDSSESASVPGTYLQHYDNGPSGYRVQSGFDGYIIPAMTGAILAHAAETPALGMASTIYKYMEPVMRISSSVLPKVGIAAVSVLALLAVGIAVALFFCAHTSICHLTFMGFDLTHESMRTFYNNDRLSEISHFVQTAIKKYQDMNAKQRIVTNEVK